MYISWGERWQQLWIILDNILSHLEVCTLFTFWRMLHWGA